MAKLFRKFPGSPCRENHQLIMRIAIAVTDKVIGLTLVGGTASVLFYYTLWVIALPFVDKDQAVIHSWFPDPLYAIGLPLLAGTAGLLFIGFFVAVVLIKSGNKEHTD